MDIRIVKRQEDARVDCIARCVTTKTVPLDAALARQGFTGEPGKVGVRSTTEICVGLQAEPTSEMLREAVGNVLQTASRLGVRAVGIVVPDGVDAFDVGAAMTEASILASYHYGTYKKAPEFAVDALTFVVDYRKFARFTKGKDRAEVLMHGVTLARDLVNAPPKDMHPEQLAQTARDIAASSKGRIKVKILEREDCEKLGMGAYLAVAQGSAFAPKFIHLTYTPAEQIKVKSGKRKAVAIVGKGITFDSGGLSLKPADAMMTMRCDMGGAAAVLGLFMALHIVAPKVVVHGIIAAAENMPSGTAYRPGDIVRAANGKTIEVLNTDAEGRLTLADALDYAVKLKPSAIVDLATLTGACVVGLGEEIAGLMSSDENLAVAMLGAAERAGEKLWEMPLEPRYRTLIDSDVADVRNIATSRYGGSLTAGLFLREFVDATPWAHMDIAGPAFAERPMASYIGKGGTGYGVRTLVEFIDSL